jgi:GNAT superfamily N-acetyltransferase
MENQKFPAPAGFLVRSAKDPEDVAAVRELWREYWASFGLSDDFQGFGQEMSGLPGVYGADGGVLLVAWSETSPEPTPAGTIALRRLSPQAGEVKRLYLRPRFRGHGLGRYLVETVIDMGRTLGYKSLFADTLPVMRDALSLYRAIGFVTVEPYSKDPTPGAIFLQLKLD